jgi:5-(carboxyamino)imidazole ribonucleotide synthase
MKRVGVIGGGQLAWMMGTAAQKLGVELIVQTPKADDPAVSLASDTIFAAIDDAQATAQLATRCDVITFENEFVDLDALAPLVQQGVSFRPRLPALAPLLDKYHQRCYLQEIGLPVPEFINLEAPEQSLESLQFPCVMKARRHGYDGQGTVILQDRQQLETTWKKWQYAPVLIEEFIPFERELAVIVARSITGEIAIYPVVETQQENQVCRRVIAPANIDSAIVRECEEIGRTLLEQLQVVGIFGIELFLTPQGKVLVNEIAPRTHNSGHFTIDACQTSQFEQHLRAVCELPLGNTQLTGAGAVMVNLLGYETSEQDYAGKRQQLAQIPGAHVHWYGKTQSRPGRKLGHVTILLDAPPTQIQKQAQTLAKQCETIWYT